VLRTSGSGLRPIKVTRPSAAPHQRGLSRHLQTLIVRGAANTLACQRSVQFSYVEVNNHSIANVGTYVLKFTDAPVFDIGPTFVAKINSGERR